jgi:formylglycine-generating enzyme required for sulfatase activity
VILPRFVRLDGGTFTMGADGRGRDESPAHLVTLRPFLAATSPVTNAEYACYLAETGLEPPPFLGDERFAHPAQPVVGVSWHDAAHYCEHLKTVSGLQFRLPTEAEREFAALGGLERADWPWPGNSHPGEATISAMDRPHPPLSECGNGHGLLCMADNVHEWCSDWYGRDYYAQSPAVGPCGPAEGMRRASRGGSWRHREKVTRVTARSSLPPAYRYSDYGFRVYATP